MTFNQENVVLEEPNMKGRLLLRLNNEAKRIQDRLDKAKEEVVKYQKELERLEEEKRWATESLEVSMENET